jgi:nucleotide-binding universal stress UspA family protein
MYRLCTINFRLYSLFHKNKKKWRRIFLFLRLLSLRRRLFINWLRSQSGIAVAPTDIQEIFLHWLRRSIMARKLKKILCPVDFSDDSLTALDYAADFARQNDGQLILLHVVDNPLADQYGPARQNFYAEVEHALEKSQQMLTDAIRTHAAGVACETMVKRGNPYEEIIDVANAQHADVIVMSTHGRTGPQRLVIGSVAEKVVRTAPCPVFTVRHQAEK